MDNKPTISQCISSRSQHSKTSLFILFLKTNFIQNLVYPQHYVRVARESFKLGRLPFCIWLSKFKMVILRQLKSNVVIVGSNTHQAFKVMKNVTQIQVESQLLSFVIL
ncbi:Hypothetical_protein [Hexamita inflata]|uniref:Hypothetical_protein n=1 Tax=Hexamita inflata TaxID=28002 RepID=A0ABP1I1S3_9EUKA